MAKTYRVIGTQGILGHPPGSEFEAEIDPVQEKFLKGIGGIEEVGATREPSGSKSRFGRSKGPADEREAAGQSADDDTTEDPASQR